MVKNQELDIGYGLALLIYSKTRGLDNHCDYMPRSENLGKDASPMGLSTTGPSVRARGDYVDPRNDCREVFGDLRRTGLPTLWRV